MFAIGASQNLRAQDKIVTQNINNFAFYVRSKSSNRWRGQIEIKEGMNPMSRSRIHHLLVALAVLALVVPMAARANPKKDPKSVHASMDLLSDASLGGKQVKAGTYEVRANEGTLTLMRGGKVIAEAPIEWKAESSKAEYSSIILESGAMKEVHFSGANRYAQISSGSAGAASGQQ